MKFTEAISVWHNVGANRYEATANDQQSVADYVIDGDRMIFTHTFVPPELRGRGIAEKLVRAALTDARTKKLKVMPVCSYVAKFIERHPEYHDLVTTE